MKISDILNESLDSSYKFREKFNDGQGGLYQFTTDDDIEYKVLFKKFRNKAEVSFEIINDSYEGPKVGISNTGDAQKVFGTVIKIIQQYVHSAPIDTLVFSAREPSRRKLYRQMINRISKIDPAWSMSSIEDQYGEEEYTLTKTGSL